MSSFSLAPPRKKLKVEPPQPLSALLLPPPRIHQVCHQGYYEMFPEAAYYRTSTNYGDHTSSSFLNKAIAAGVSCSSLRFLVQMNPTAVNKELILSLLSYHHDNHDYVTEALDILLEVCPYALETQSDENHQNLKGSLLGDAIEAGYNRKILDVIVNRCVTSNVIGEELWLDGCAAGDEDNEDGTNLYPISYPVAVSLRPILTSLTTLSMGVNKTDLEGCTQILNGLQSSRNCVLTNLFLRVQAMTPCTLSLCFGLALQNLLTNKHSSSLEQLSIGCCDSEEEEEEDTDGATHDYVIQALYNARLSLPDSLEDLHISNPIMKTTTNLYKVFLQGNLPKKVQLYLGNETLHDPSPSSSSSSSSSWEEGDHQGLLSKGCCFWNSSNRFCNLENLTLACEITKTSMEGLGRCLVDGMPRLESLKLYCTVVAGGGVGSNNELYRYDSTKVFASLINKGIIKSLIVDSEIYGFSGGELDGPTLSVDMKVICEALKTNQSLEHMEICAHLKDDSDDDDDGASEDTVGYLEDVLCHYNSTLRSVILNHGEDGLNMDKVHYYTNLNHFGRQLMRDPSISLTRCISVLEEAVSAAAPSEEDTDDGSDDADSNDSSHHSSKTRTTLLLSDSDKVGIVYGLLHESVSVWSS